jgi:hypothetical protein
MRAFFANGVDKMHVPWAVEGLPTLLHLSLFLFFGGLVIFLFNVDQEVFMCVASWIGLFSIVYGLITLLPTIRQDSTYNTPLSILAWFLYASSGYVTFKLFEFIYNFCGSYDTWYRCRDLGDRYRGWVSGGVEKKAEETVEEQSSEVDARILGWTISALGDDDSLEKFFEAIPGLFNSRLVNDLERDFPETLLETFWDVLNGFMGRTSSSNSVAKSVKVRRDTICRDVISMIPCPHDHVHGNLYLHFNQTPVSIDRLQAMGRWFTHSSLDVSDTARIAVIRRLPRLQERDYRWITLASNACSLAAQDIQNNVALRGDNMLLSTLICISRKAIDSYDFGRFDLKFDLAGALTQIDICHTSSALQDDFCTFWNEMVQEGRNQGNFSNPVQILRRIRRLYIALHQDTDAAPTAFSAHSPSTDNLDDILYQSSSYPLCDIASHRQSAAPVPDLNSRAVSPLTQLLAQLADSSDASPNQSSTTISGHVKRVTIISGHPSLSHPTTPSSEIGDNSQVPAASSLGLPVHTITHPTDASLPSALQDIPPAATLSCPPEGTTLENIAAPCAEPDTSEILSTPSTPTSTPTATPTPVTETTPRVLDESSTSCDADAASASASNPLLSASSVVGFSVPASPPLPNAGFLALLDDTTPCYLKSNAALPHLRARGLVNTGTMCFANAVLQLLVHSPPLRNLFRQMGDLKEQRGVGPEPGGCATPLVDTTIRFFEEFMNKEKGPPPTEQPPRQATGGNPREANAVDSFEPTYIYDTMKEKTQLKCLLVSSCATYCPAVPNPR